MTTTLFCWDCKRSQTYLAFGVPGSASDSPMDVNMMVNVRCEACAQDLGYIGDGVVKSADVSRFWRVEQEGEDRIKRVLGGTVAILGNPPGTNPKGSLYMDAAEYMKGMSSGRAVISIDEGRGRRAYDDFCPGTTINVHTGIVRPVQ